MKLSSKILITVNFVALLLTSTASINILSRISKDNSTHDNVFTLLAFIGLLFISLTLLKILYNIGFNFNDNDYNDKLIKLKVLNIDDVDFMTKILLCGFNVNNKGMFSIIDRIIKLNIPLTQEYFDFLYLIGFNFNTLLTIKNLEVISKIVNVSNIGTYKNLVHKKFNLNNPDYRSNVRSSTILKYDNEVDDLISGTGLKVVNDLNIKNGEISSIVLDSIFEQYNKLGLSSKDDKFKEMSNLFLNKLDIKLDESVFINSERNITLTYYDYKDRNKKVVKNLNDSIVDSKIYEDEKYKANLEIEYINSPNYTVTSIIQFDSLNKLGFNFKNDYIKFLNILNSLSFDINTSQTVNIVDNFINIGWH
ncbi:hypothetical protein KAU43_04145, partial [candidate division WOR-3 bacterium]|nr:hypothetical protein [candidate division WOR-3 bacterium]